MGQSIENIEEENFEENLENESNEDRDESVEENLLNRLENLIDSLKSQDQTLHKTSKRFGEEYFVDINQKINNIIFYDSGLVKPYVLLDNRIMETMDNMIMETIVCNPKNDLVIKKFLLHLHESHDVIIPEEYSSKKNLQQSILLLGKILIREVNDFFGGSFNEDLDEKSREVIKRIQMRDRKNVIQLGLMKGYGNCRHRSILFKVLCDEFRIPCRILRGNIVFNNKSSHPHMWNEIVCQSEIYMVDCTYYLSYVNTTPGYESSEIVYQNLGHPLSELAQDKKTVELVKEDYQNLKSKHISSGTFGSVYELSKCKVVSKSSSQDEFKFSRKDLCVKEINLSKIHELSDKHDISNMIKKEMELVKLLKHDNVVKIYGTFTSKNDFEERIFHIIMEKYVMDGYRLKKIIDRIDCGRFSEEKKCLESIIFLLGVAKGLSYIHSFSVVHFDVKPSNILVNWDERKMEVKEVRITDFGSCKENGLDTYLTTIPNFTRHFAAPEIVSYQFKKEVEEEGHFPVSFTHKSDIYSFSIVIKDFLKFFPEDFSSRIHEIVKQCTCADPSDRPELSHIIVELERILGIIIQKIEPKVGQNRKNKVDIVKKKILENELGIAERFFNTGLDLFNKGNYIESLDTFEKSLSLRSKCLGEDHMLVSDCYFHIGSNREVLNDLSSALIYYKKCLRIRNENSDYGGIAKCYEQIGGVYRRQRDFKRSLDHFQHGLKLLEKESYNGKDEDIAVIYNNMGGVYEDQKEFSMSSEFYKKSLKILKNALPERRVNIAELYNNMGNLHYRMKNYSFSLEYYQKCLKIRLMLFPKDHPQIIVIYDNLGNVYSELGRYKESHECIEKVRNSSVDPSYLSLESNDEERMKTILRTVKKLVMKCPDKGIRRTESITVSVNISNHDLLKIASRMFQVPSSKFQIELSNGDILVENGMENTLLSFLRKTNYSSHKIISVVHVARPKDNELPDWCMFNRNIMTEEEELKEKELLEEFKKKINDFSFIEHYTVMKLLGTGSFAHTFLCRIQKIESHSFAVKILKEPGRLEMIKRDSLQIPYHKNIVRILSDFEKEEIVDFSDPIFKKADVFGKKRVRMPIIVMLRYQRTLEKYLYERFHLDESPMRDLEVCYILKGLLDGVSHLHKNWIVHRDLHSRNIFIDARWGRIWIGDFGCHLNLWNRKSFLVDTSDQILLSQSNSTASIHLIGCSRFRAPEIDLNEDVVDFEKVDLFSVGLIGELLISVKLEGRDSRITNLVKRLGERDRNIRIGHSEACETMDEIIRQLRSSN